MVGIVGARACSDYGARVARKLARELGESGITVVSGMARGIDTHAHWGAIEGGGQTIAVLGCGIDRDYPVANTGLAKKIEENGALLSEYKPGVEPAPWRFPARNRIIAHMVDVLLVVEARERSGSLITAHAAMEVGCWIFAVAGEIDSPLSEGSNALIEEGHATPVFSTETLVNATLAHSSWRGLVTR